MVDRVHFALREDIRMLELPPGMKLLTGFLTSRYGVGSSPLREALSLLCGRGFVVRESRRGFRVSPMSLKDLDDLIAIRLTVELAMLERAIGAGDAAWEMRIRNALATLMPSLQKVGDARPLDRLWGENHQRFHIALMATDETSLLVDFCRVLYDRYDRYRMLGVPRRAYLAAVADDHADMAEAAIARDAVRARAILHRHIADTSAVVRSNIIAAGFTDNTGEVHVPPPGSSVG